VGGHLEIARLLLLRLFPQSDDDHAEQTDDDVKIGLDAKQSLVRDLPRIQRTRRLINDAILSSVLQKQETTARILLKYRANVEQRDAKGDTLLITAIRAKDINMVRLLLDFGADVNNPDIDGLLPYDVAFEHGGNEKWSDIL
jgi:ankyrin repeat protein